MEHCISRDLKKCRLLIGIQFGSTFIFIVHIYNFFSDFSPMLGMDPLTKKIEEVVNFPQKVADLTRQ